MLYISLVVPLILGALLRYSHDGDANISSPSYTKTSGVVSQQDFWSLQEVDCDWWTHLVGHLTTNNQCKVAPLVEHTRVQAAERGDALTPPLPQSIQYPDVILILFALKVLLIIVVAVIRVAYLILMHFVCLYIRWRTGKETKVGTDSGGTSVADDLDTSGASKFLIPKTTTSHCMNCKLDSCTRCRSFNRRAAARKKAKAAALIIREKALAEQREAAGMKKDHCRNCGFCHRCRSLKRRDIHKQKKKLRLRAEREQHLNEATEPSSWSHIFNIPKKLKKQN